MGGDKREIRFRNGYGSSRPEFIALCTLDIKTGREEWGAEPGKEYYTLKIHEITEKRGVLIWEEQRKNQRTKRK